MKQMEHLNILVVGDIMLDKYVLGDINRLSPEAPVAIVDVTDKHFTLGGCGNVVRNLRVIGAQVDCIASVAKDDSGKKIKDTLKNMNVTDCVVEESIQTTVKKRIIANNTKTQLLRIDQETYKKIDFIKIIHNFELYKKDKYDLVIVSDYAKGMISRGLIEYLQDLKGQPKIIVDPKPINGFLYNDVYMITPNSKEWDTMKFTSEYNLKNVEYILKTEGPDGMTLISKTYNHKILAKPKDIFNVSGAGDTVVAVMGVCISIGLEPEVAAEIANKCAGYVVTKPGTSTIPKEKFQQYFNEVTNQ